MRAIRRSRYGGPETLEVVDVDPEPLEPGRVRLRVTAASLNPFEWHHMRGLPWLMRPTSGWRSPRNRDSEWMWQVSSQRWAARSWT